MTKLIEVFGKLQLVRSYAVNWSHDSIQFSRPTCCGKILTGAHALNCGDIGNFSLCYNYFVQMSTTGVTSSNHESMNSSMCV